MSTSNPGDYFRSWMDKPHQDSETMLWTTKYAEEVSNFIAFATNQEANIQEGKKLCPCTRCRNYRLVFVSEVWNHMYRRGFMAGYKIWYSHGENDSMVDFASTNNYDYTDVADVDEEPAIVDSFGQNAVEMVNDAFRENVEVEAPNLEARRFFDMLTAAKQPLYHGCKEEHSPFSSATRLMTKKTDYNLSEDCLDAFADYLKDKLPEDNIAASSYYDIQRLVSGLGLPCQVIDVCIDNCMIYWREDKYRLSCRFCHKPRYKDISGRVSIPFKRMWYLTLTERLKRLYQSRSTGEAMRWHEEHISDGEIAHPSDVEAWKHSN